MTTITGYKFLTPYGSTLYNDVETLYVLPGPNDEWGPWNVHPDPAPPDGHDCGPGRFHGMKRLDARYAPQNWWPWKCEGRGLIGESDEKFGAAEMRLKRISAGEFWKLIRDGECAGANLIEANLSRANLSRANLIGANLTWANLTDANLTWANLTDADLIGANLSRADLTGANLTGADLTGANLTGANLTGADLTGANLTGADLTGANLTGADLTGAIGL